MKGLSVFSLILLLFSSSFSGCESTKPVANGKSLCGTALDMSASLEGIQGKWKLMAHGNAGLSMAECVQGTVQTSFLEFKENGTLQATGACNSSTANYTAAGGRLMLTGLAFTEKLCGDPEALTMKWDDRLIKALQGVTTYEMIGNALHLKTNNGNDIYLLPS